MDCWLSKEISNNRHPYDDVHARLLELLEVGRLLVGGLVKVLNEVGDLVVVSDLTLLLLAGLGGGGGLAGGHRLVRLGKAAEVGERVGAELVEDTRDELGELLGLATAVDGEGVGSEGTVDGD